MLTLIVAGSAVALAIIWIVFPLAVALAARLRRPAQPHWATPTISVVVATREELAIVRRRLADRRRTTYPTDLVELVVAIDRRDARVTVAELAAAEPGVRVVQGDEPGGKAAALNAGVRAATGTVIVFADSQQTFAPDAIAQLVTATMAPGVGAASGVLELPPGKRGNFVIRAYWRYEIWLRRNEARLHSSVGVFGPIWAMRRELWAPIPAGLILDDVYTPMRLVIAGHRVAFAQAAVAVDLRAPEPSTEYRRKVRTLTGNLQLVAWLPAVVNPFRNPIWVQYVCHKLLRFLTPYFAIAFVLSGTIAAGLAVRGMITPVVLGVLAALVVVVIALRPLREFVHRVAHWGIAVNGALLTATLNGVRGRWDVWQR